MTASIKAKHEHSQSNNASITLHYFLFKLIPKLIRQRIFGSGAVAGKILLVTNACQIFDYWDVSRSSSTRNNPRTANGYKSWNLQLYKNPSTTNFETILVLATFPFFFIYVTHFHIPPQQLKLNERPFQNVINIRKIYYS